MDLKNLLEKNVKEIDKVIMSFLPDSHSIKEIDLLYKMLREYPSRPKKGLRSTLCLLSCEAFGGSYHSALITASALEIFQNWILIHDDIEDQSELRRGKPTLHRMYNVPLALNAGDALHGKMWELLLKNREILGDTKTLDIMLEIIHMIRETTEGQNMELGWVYENKWELNYEDYITMVEKKTSWYTCITPLRLGALIADAEREKMDKMIKFGKDLGIAFQIRDDHLNLVEGEGKYGKEWAGDLFEGKRTLQLIHLIKNCESLERERVLEIMSKRREDKSKEDILYIFNLMKKYNSLDFSLSMAQEYAKRAKEEFYEIFGDLPNTEAKNYLEEIVDFMISRKW
ncbi:(2E,6E)-farnesyl diphosphate synthase [archaeon HR06]|nr:(2E,6E)-farnesyl diphosphate synthase [archaeon HR06]